MKNILRCVFFVCLAVLFSIPAVTQQAVPPPPRPANDAPANAEILKLLRAGMPERTILHVISGVAGTFDTSTDALAVLKQAGASEAELSAIVAQGGTPASPPAAGAQTNSVPSLAETMQFIQDKVNQQGKIVYIESASFFTGENTQPQQISVESRVIAVDPAGGLSLQDDFDLPLNKDPLLRVDGVFKRKTWQLNFKDVEKLEVLNYVDLQNRYHPGVSYQCDPLYYELVIHLAAGKTVKRHTLLPSRDKHNHNLIHNYETDENIREFALHFRDEETAGRVAKAIIHAVELCGGGSKPEPF